MAIFKTALGDKDSGEEFDTVGLHFAELAVTATNMRHFVAAMWKSELGLGSFASVTDDICLKSEVALKPAEEFEEEDTEVVDLYKGSFSLAFGTSRGFVVRRCTSSATGSAVWDRASAVRRR